MNNLKLELATPSYINNLSTMIRCKNTIPFSERLNNFVTNFYLQHQNVFEFVDEDDFDGADIEGTLARYVEHYKNTGKIKIWTGASDATIFGDATVNHFFRAWHDYIHITMNLGFDLAGESLVCEIQKQMLPNDWIYERDLVQSEIVGQALYFSMNGDFICNQRLFTIIYLQNPVTAMQLPVA